MNKKTISLLIVVCLLISGYEIALSAAATENTCEIRAPLSKDSLSPDAISGIYKYDFENSFADGRKYHTENYLKFFKHSQSSVYFDTHLNFSNGHQCALSGIADIKGDELIYHGLIDENGNECMLHLKFTKGAIDFDDPTGQCRKQSCGSRGGYSRISFPRSGLQKIEDIEFTNTRQYSDAIKKYDLIKERCTK